MSSKGSILMKFRQVDCLITFEDAEIVRKRLREMEKISSRCQLVFKLMKGGKENDRDNRRRCEGNEGVDKERG